MGMLEGFKEIEYKEVSAFVPGSWDADNHTQTFQRTKITIKYTK